MLNRVKSFLGIGSGKTEPRRGRPHKRPGLGVELLEARDVPTTLTWLGTVNSDWANTGNWSGGADPADNPGFWSEIQYDIELSGSAVNSIDFTSTATNAYPPAGLGGNLTVASGYDLDIITGSFFVWGNVSIDSQDGMTWNGGDLSIDGDFTVASAVDVDFEFGDAEFNGDVELEMDADGQITVGFWESLQFKGAAFTVTGANTGVAYLKTNNIGTVYLDTWATQFDALTVYTNCDIVNKSAVTNMYGGFNLLNEPTTGTHTLYIYDEFSRPLTSLVPAVNKLGSGTTTIGLKVDNSGFLCANGSGTFALNDTVYSRSGSFVQVHNGEMRVNGSTTTGDTDRPYCSLYTTGAVIDHHAGALLNCENGLYAVSTDYTARRTNSGQSYTASLQVGGSYGAYLYSSDIYLDTEHAGTTLDGAKTGNFTLSVGYRSGETGLGKGEIVLQGSMVHTYINFSTPATSSITTENAAFLGTNYIDLPSYTGSVTAGDYVWLLAYGSIDVTYGAIPTRTAQTAPLTSNDDTVGGYDVFVLHY
jgi:hypothetical protein